MTHKTRPKSKTNSGEGGQTFDLFFESHPIPMFVYDLKTLAVLRVNDAMIEKYGYSQDEMQALTLKDILPAQDVKKEQPGLLHSGEWRHQCKDGSVIDVDITSHALEFDGREAALVMAQDITERKKAEQALRESEKHYHSLFDGMLDGIYRSTPEGKFIYVNESMVKMFGYSSIEEMLEVDIINMLYFAPEERHSVTEVNVNAEPEVYRMRRKDGSEIWVEDRENYVYNDQGKTIYHGGMLRDVTQRKQAEEALRESEERYHLLFDGMLDGYYRSTHDGKFIDVNPAMVKMFGYSSREEMLEMDIKNELYFAPEERGTHILDTGLGETDVYRLRRKDGSEIWVEDRGFYIYDEQGTVIYHEGSLRDVTQRKQAEEGLYRAKESLELANRELENVLMREQQLARTDGLTGLCNYRYFFELASHEFSASIRYQRPLAVLMFDTDYLKQVNDTLGHMVGDSLLVLVAQTAVAQLRSVDVLARYGGDEFVVLLSQTSAQQAFPIAERIRASVAALRMQTEKGPLSVTLSIGIAEIWREPADESVERIVQRADKALYTAKQAGRNRTVVFIPE
jgi:diguanylate cyclase (GGDEF)-like protein/PAS domain S-box-containing protein